MPAYAGMTRGASFPRKRESSPRWSRDRYQTVILRNTECSPLGFAVAVLFVVSTLAVAGEMMCTKADDKGYTMAKGADGKEMAVMGAGMKMGDKIDCMSKTARWSVRKAT